MKTSRRIACALLLVSAALAPAGCADEGTVNHAPPPPPDAGADAHGAGGSATDAAGADSGHDGGEGGSGGESGPADAGPG